MMNVSSTSACELGSSMTPKIIATWDSPPRQDEPGYSAFKVAFESFLDSRRVHIKLRNKKEIETFERRRKNEFRQKYASEKDQQPDLGQQERLKLMPFQVN
jgi:chromodomain-helicase-DNA-binding protein 4